MATMLSSKRNVQYIYQDGDGYLFMDTENDEQITFSTEEVGNRMLYLREGLRVAIVMDDGLPMRLELPSRVELRIVEAEEDDFDEPTRPYKTAIMETGLKVSVPSFVAADEIILVDTRTGQYVDRQALTKL